eukprot:6188789-Pleurochrysis_carterae.AAC.3
MDPRPRPPGSGVMQPAHSKPCFGTVFEQAILVVYKSCNCGQSSAVALTAYCVAATLSAAAAKVRSSFSLRASISRSGASEMVRRSGAETISYAKVLKLRPNPNGKTGVPV